MKGKLESISKGHDITFFKVLRRTMGMLYGPHALEGFNGVINSQFPLQNTLRTEISHIAAKNGNFKSKAT